MVSFFVFLGNVELMMFFAADFVFAHTLNNLKLDHPAIDDCSPPQSPDLDAGAILNSLKETANDLYNHEVDRLGRDDAYQSIPSSAELESGHMYVEDTPMQTVRGNVLHASVVVCGFLAPLFATLQLLFPDAMNFARFSTPQWLQFLAVVPGMVIVGLYVTRTMRVLLFTDVTKSQWLQLMWFRLDLMCLLAALTLVGMGSWLVSLCMIAVSLYLAHRLLNTEKRLSRAQHTSQLIRREVDLERVYVPGTAEAARALGKDTIMGYQSV